MIDSKNGRKFSEQDYDEFRRIVDIQRRTGLPSEATYVYANGFKFTPNNQIYLDIALRDFGGGANCVLNTLRKASWPHPELICLAALRLDDVVGAFLELENYKMTPIGQDEFDVYNSAVEDLKKWAWGLRGWMYSIDVANGCIDGILWDSLGEELNLTADSGFEDVCTAVSYMDNNAETPRDLAEAWKMLECICDPEGGDEVYS